ncbi:MAG: hypothetical protein LUQ47_01445 [Methanotrichaceae archaeon]|nr:hypothetical protein [Methanotrichaceae archaeon]
MQEQLALIENKTLVGKRIPMGQVALYPIARLSILRASNESIQSFWLSPIALILTGPGFDIPLTLAINNEKFDLESLDLPSDLRTSLESKKRHQQR